MERGTYPDCVTTPQPYHHLPGLEYLYLEDSYVLRIRWADGTLIFWLEAVLTEGHPDYVPPRRGEQYCYQRCLLTFHQPDVVQWEELDTLAAKDAAGELDLGNINMFQDLDGRYLLAGGWGMVLVMGPPPVEAWPEHDPSTLYRDR